MNYRPGNQKVEEAIEVDFKFEMNLEQMCLVKISSSLWLNKDIWGKILLFLQNNYQNSKEFQKEKRSNWNIIMKDVLSHVNNLLLPAKFISRLKHVTWSIGLKLFSRIKYIINVVLLESIHYRGLHLSYYSYTDIEKILKNWVMKTKLKPQNLWNNFFVVVLDHITKSYLHIVSDKEDDKSKLHFSSLLKKRLYNNFDEQ